MKNIGASGAVGVVLAVVLAGWALLSAPAAPGGPAFAAMLLAAVVAWAFGSALSRVHRLAPAYVVAGLVSAAVVFTLPASLSGQPVAPPTGYANANAALITAAVVALVVAAGHVEGRRRHWLLAWVGLLTVVAFATGSRAGAAGCLFVLVVWAVLSRGKVVVWQLGGAAALVAVVGLTAWSGATYQPMERTHGVEATFDSTRTALWSEAIDIAMASPVHGVGPGNFSRVSETAGADPDIMTAHSTPLSVLAELGFVGLALLMLLVAWMVAALGRGAVFLTVLALQPTVDYVLDFPAVSVAAAVVLGAIAASGMGRPGVALPRPRSVS
jgi:O-antigen ligase